MQAALDAGAEIGFTILSISISLVAVFIPLLLMSGMVGRMFQEFAVTVTVAIAVSALVSLTLTPMMGARLLRHERPEEQGRLSRGLEWCFDGLLAGYDRALVVALRHRFVTLMVMLGTVVLTGWLFSIIPKGSFPEQDTGLILGVTQAGRGRLASRNGYAAAARCWPWSRRIPRSGGQWLCRRRGAASTGESKAACSLRSSPMASARRFRPSWPGSIRRRGGVTGLRLFMQPVQDINIGGRLTATQYRTR